MQASFALMWRWFNINADGSLERVGDNRISDASFETMRSADRNGSRFYQSEIVFDTDKLFARKIGRITQFFIHEDLLARD